MRRLRWLVPIVVIPLLAWTLGALLFGPFGIGSAIRIALAATLLVVSVAFAWRMRARGVAVAAFAMALPSIAFACAWPFLTGGPRGDREWTPELSRAATAEVEGDKLVVRDVRNFRWRSLSDFDAAWEDRSYDLAKLVRVWFVLVPFHDQDSVAHTFLSFEFEGGDFLAFSPEIRKEKGESFSASGGLFRNFELFYTVGDERDLVKLRTDFFGDEVFVFPVRGTKEGARTALLDVIGRVNGLAATPEWYDALTNSCAVNVARHANAVIPGSIGRGSWRVALPGWSDELALELGFIDFDGTVPEARARFKANEKAAAASDAPDFSTRIRATP